MKKITAFVILLFLLSSIMLLGCGNSKKVKTKKVDFSAIDFTELKFPRNNLVFKEIGSFAVFRNTAVFASGSGEMTRKNPPCLSLENNLVTFNITENKVISILKADEGYYQICNITLNSRWIVFEEIKNEVGVPGRVYAIDRQIGKKELVYSIGDDSSSVKETFINPPFPHQIVLHENSIYIPLVKGDESKIVKVDLKSLETETVFYRKGGGYIFSVSNNGRYIAIDYAENGKSEILLYNFETGETSKLTETDKLPGNLWRVQFPVLTDNGYVVLEKCINLNCKDNKIVLASITRPSKIKTYDLNMINLCSSGNYIAGVGLEDTYVMNIKTNIITDIENLNGYNVYIDGNVLFVKLQKREGTKIIYINLDKIS